jgi:iron(III) transport system substrate-binding protein
VIAYNPEFVGEENLPDSVLGFTHPVWRGRVGWAPSNASFQAFVTALRMTAGDDVTRQWLIDMRANDTRSYASNTAIVLAVASGEIHAGIPNHYYLHAIQKDQGPISARNYHPRAGGVDAMVNVAGAGILRTSRNPAGAQRFVDYLLSQSAQEYFARETFEYPLVQGIPAAPNVTPISELRVPDFDLGSLADLNGTLRLLRETNVL